MGMKLIINWMVYFTAFVWMPILFIITEIVLIPKMLRTPKEKRCETYRALFVGDVWFFKFSEWYNFVFGKESTK